MGRGIVLLFAIVLQFFSYLVVRITYPTYHSSEFSIWYFLLPIAMPVILILSVKWYNKLLVILVGSLLIGNSIGLYGITEGTIRHYGDYDFEVLNITCNMFFLGNELFMQEMPHFFSEFFSVRISIFISFLFCTLAIYIVLKLYQFVYSAFSTA